MHRHAVAGSDGCAELVSRNDSYLAADALADSFSNDSNSHKNPNAAAD
jgi:hypothetical protein